MGFENVFKYTSVDALFHAKKVKETPHGRCKTTPGKQNRHAPVSDGDIDLLHCNKFSSWHKRRIPLTDCISCQT